jgi:hypothetical protein
MQCTLYQYEQAGSTIVDGKVRMKAKERKESRRNLHLSYILLGSWDKLSPRGIRAFAIIPCRGIREIIRNFILMNVQLNSIPREFITLQHARKLRAYYFNERPTLSIERPIAADITFNYDIKLLTDMDTKQFRSGIRVLYISLQKQRSRTRKTWKTEKGLSRQCLAAFIFNAELFLLRPRRSSWVKILRCEWK